MTVFDHFTRPIRNMWDHMWRILRFIVLLLIASFLLGGAVIPFGGFNTQVRAFTRDVEFDFATWTLKALGNKVSGWALSIERFIEPELQSQIVLDTLEQVRKVNQLNAELVMLYSDPTIQGRDYFSRDLKAVLQQEQALLDSMAPVAESILQNQLMDVLRDVGMDMLGQVIPPPLYQTSATPNNLIISPRTEIRQVMSISLTPGFPTDYRDAIEEKIFNKLDHAALVAPVGGIGTYPNMVMQTTDLVWLTEVIAHEWVHNFLTLRPLGVRIFTSPELYTINETTATLAGEELGLLILIKYYPDHVPPELIQPPPDSVHTQWEFEPDPEIFDFREQMRITRVEVDHLLANGEVEAAESYMETRRTFFWENGYPIRKLNQAYFAFYGAYNAAPGGGPSGEDPVGPAVVAFRESFNSLADFLNAISWVTSFEDLLDLMRT